MINMQDEFEEAVESHNINKIKLLMRDVRVDPTYLDNCYVAWIYYEKFNPDFIEIENEMLELFWSDRRVKSSLQKDRPEIYRELIKKDVNNKVSEF